jgi:hypothetical protein
MRRAGDIATALYYTGIDPFTKKKVHVAKGLKDRKMQRLASAVRAHRSRQATGRAENHNSDVKSGER